MEHNFNKFIHNAILEDLGDGDHTSRACITKGTKKKAKLIIKDKGIIAGIELAKIIFNYINPKLVFKSFLSDGDNVNKNDIAFEIEGDAISILKSERLVLNCMQRMSAISTKTNFLNSLIKNTNCKLLDTRKTTPNNREIEKWAVRIGGGYNHRFGLYDMIMIKDNHIDYAGGISKAINKTKEYLSSNNKNLKIIIEARNIIEVNQIIETGGIDRILLDNFSIEDTLKSVKLINKKYQTESSGSINEKTIQKYANCGVDFISLGLLTNSIDVFDLSMKAS